MLELFVGAALEALRSGAPVSPVGLTVLTRVFGATGRDDIAEAIGTALATAIAAARPESPVTERADWLRLFAEAAELTSDPRLRDAAADVAADLQRALAPYADTPFADRAAAVHAILAASGVVDARRFVPDAIDELERLIASSYAPGEGLPGCVAADYVAVALALLAAFDVTGRLAYPMLAEELMRTVSDDLAAAPVASRCDAARVFGHLARLHADEGYRTTAVLAPGADYALDATTLLDRIRRVPLTPHDAAAYALALTECANGS